ncbi:MAG: phage tail sheath family protein [Oceanihabitans sp.]
MSNTNNTILHNVVPVATAIPAFVGYTQHTAINGVSVLQKAIQINSLAEFYSLFGSEPPSSKFKLELTPANLDVQLADGNSYILEVENGYSRLFGAIQLFYANGGLTCIVVSVDDYNSKPDPVVLKTGLDVLLQEKEPTIIVIPDAADLVDESILSNTANYMANKYQPAYDLQSEMITHCGEKTQSRFAILDIPNGFKEPTNNTTQSIDAFRDNVTSVLAISNSYAAAYYPWLETSIFKKKAITHLNISDAALVKLNTILRIELAAALDPAIDTHGKLDVLISYLTKTAFKSTASTAIQYALLTPENQEKEQANASKALLALSVSYSKILDVILKKFNLMAPSAAIAGVYTSVDTQRGVWKAPANVFLQKVIAPSITVNKETQEYLNVSNSGKSICAIRFFSAKGTCVWGARTLEGNSNEWRYVSVRRTIIFIEQSIALALKPFALEPNDANTWVQIKAMVENFLLGIWREGGLMGAKPSVAFAVTIGLGSSMTANDLQLGVLRIYVSVALIRPAEFHVITLTQKMAAP